MATTKINVYSKTDGKPRRKIVVDEFSYTVTTTGGEAVVTLPGSRTYSSTDFMRVDANGIKINSGLEYTRGVGEANTTITAAACNMFPDGKFPENCVLGFELYSTN